MKSLSSLVSLLLSFLFVGLKRTRDHATLDDLHRKERYMVEETESTLKAKGNLQDNILQSSLCSI